MGSRSATQFVKKWGEKVQAAIEHRIKSELTPTDRKAIADLIRTQNKYFSPEGLELKDEAQAQLDYVVTMQDVHSSLPRKKYKIDIPGAVPSANNFLVQFSELYESNKNFQDSLVVSLLKSAVYKLKTGCRNPMIEEKVTGFIRVLGTYNKTCASIASANLGGPSKRWMRQLNSHDRDPSILQSDFEDIVACIEEGLKTRGAPSPDRRVAFSIGIDATKVSKGVEVSSGYKAVVGCPYPDHFICVQEKTPSEIEDLSKASKLDSEAKMGILMIQNLVAGMSPSAAIACRPQTNNETSCFTKLVECAAKAAAKNTPGARFLNWAVDGVSLKSGDVGRAICDFLSGIANHLGSTDVNHNVKSWRYQIIGGLCIPQIGTNVVDADLLRVSGISMDLIRYHDFASDLLVLKLASSKSVKKIAALVQAGPTDFTVEEAGCLALVLLVMRLHLHATNGVGAPSDHRAFYSWVSMVVLTSLEELCITTKRNIVCDTIPSICLMVQSDVLKPRNTTTEAMEHTFGTFRQVQREFTVLELAQLCDKHSCCMDLMFKNGFVPSRDPQKGYGGTFFQWYKANRYRGNESGGSTVVSDDDGASPVIDQV